MPDAATTAKLKAFEAAFVALNRHHNLVSRGDVDHFWERHIAHSLALTARPFAPGSHIVDWGTGGGLPAIPLAIALPQLKITAVDSVQKKVLAVRKMQRSLGLDHLRVWCGRAEEWPGQATYSVARATAPLVNLWGWHRRVAQPASTTRSATKGAWHPGLLSLKGGDLKGEVDTLRQAYPGVQVKVVPLDHMGRWFRDKVIVHVYESERRATRGE